MTPFATELLEDTLETSPAVVGIDGAVVADLALGKDSPAAGGGLDMTTLRAQACTTKAVAVASNTAGDLRDALDNENARLRCIFRW